MGKKTTIANLKKENESLKKSGGSNFWLYFISWSLIAIFALYLGLHYGWI